MTDEPTRDSVIEQLNRIIASPGFTAGPRVQKFLTHLVTEELDGRGDLLKGTSLAMDVFGRGAEFDSNNDPVVRIEAIKLRKAIEHYYLTSGHSDKIRIDVPKGRYRPTFTTHQRRRDEARPARTGMPTVAVVAFDGAGTEKSQLYCDGLPEEIALELGRFGHIQVISGWHLSTEGGGQTLQGIAGRADYILRGNVRDAGGALRISVQLNRLPGETLVWSDRFRVAATESDPFDLQETIARKCATRMADAYGAVAQDLSAQYSGRKAEDAEVFEALLAFHAHMRTSRLDSFVEFRDLARQAVLDNPSSGLANALRAIVEIEAVTMGTSSVREILEPGRIHSEKAIALAPQCQEALFAAAAFAQARGDDTRYRNLIARAIEANPNGTLMIALAGGWLAKAGNLEDGLALVQDARARNPLLPAWTAITFAIGPLLRGDAEAASEQVSDIDARDSLYDWMLIGAMHSLAGKTDLEQSALSHFDRMNIDPTAYAEAIPMEDKLKTLVLEGLARARKGP